MLQELKIGNKVAQHCLYKTSKKLSELNDVASWPYADSPTQLVNIRNNNENYIALKRNFIDRLKKLATYVCEACCGWGHVAYPAAKKLICPVTALVDYCYYNANDKPGFNAVLGKIKKYEKVYSTIDDQTWVDSWFPEVPRV